MTRWIQVRPDRSVRNSGSVITRKGSAVRGQILEKPSAVALALLACGLAVVSCSVGHSETQPVQPVLVSYTPPPAAVQRAEAILRQRAPRLTADERRGVAEALAGAETEHGLDALLVLALIDQESRYDPRARGPKGSLGLMQVRPFVGRDVAKRHNIPWKGSQTLIDPVLNVRIGQAYLAEMKRMFRQDELALTAYNMGPYRLKRILAQGRALRSRYAARVLKGYLALQRQFPVAPPVESL